MTPRTILGGFSTAMLALCAVALSSPAAAAAESVLFNLPANSNVYGRLEEDNKGALYGTGFNLDGNGAIFRLRERRGVWKFSTLFDFSGGNGANPFAGLDGQHATGSFFGVTEFGGGANQGVAFSLTPSGTGFDEETIHSFSGSDGTHPAQLLTLDKTTNALYGTTFDGGNSGCGTAFELSQSGGSWTYTVLHTFGGGTDGCNPSSQLRPGRDIGTLIGTTGAAGGHNDGTVYQLTESHGIWNLKTIYAFHGRDGSFPHDIDISRDGTVYGVTSVGGEFSLGVVFKLVPDGRRWDYSVLHQFSGGNDGINPVGLHFDETLGVIYGATQNGGSSSAGTVFRWGPSGQYAVLYSFAGGSDGAHPNARPLEDSLTGDLFGATTSGGTRNGGTIYRVNP